MRKTRLGVLGSGKGSNLDSLARYCARAGSSMEIVVVATDNLAIRAVRWRDDRGRTGTAKLRWIVDSGDAESGWKWRMKWWVRGLRVPGGATKIWVRAEDIKGLATVRSIRIPR